MRAKRLEMTSDQVSMGLKSAVWAPRAASIAKKRTLTSAAWLRPLSISAACYVLMGVFMDDTKAADGAARGLGFLFLLMWYFMSGRPQSKYVKEKFGATYPRQPWGKALLMAVGAIIGYFIAAVLIGFVLGFFMG